MPLPGLEFVSLLLVYNSDKKILFIDPNHSDSLHLLGVLTHQNGQNDIAEDLINKAIRVNPSFAEAHYNLGKILDTQGKLDEASACYQKALRVRPNYVEAHYNLGTILKAQGKLDAASACYQKAVEIKQDFIEAHINLGNVLKALDDLYGAAASYNKALQVKPDSVEAHINLGIVFDILGDYDEAEARIRSAIQLEPNRASTWRNLAMILARKEKYREAETAIRHSIELDPESAKVQADLGMILQKMGRIDDAEKAAREATRIEPDFSHGWMTLSTILTTAERLAEAEEYARKAIQLNSDSYKVYSQLGRVLAGAERYDEAEEAIRKAIELKPEAADIYLQLGDVLTHAESLDEAEAKYRRAIQLSSNSADGYLKLGHLYKKREKISEAIKCFQKALHFKPDNLTELTNLICALSFSYQKDRLPPLRKAFSSDPLHNVDPNPVQVFLVFSPFAFPIVPLGISSIKSYIEQNSDISVKCVDLNLLWNRQFISAVGEDGNNVNPADQEGFLDAVHLIGNNSKYFYDRDLYENSAHYFYTTLPTIYRHSAELCRQAYLLGKNLPWYIVEYADALLSANPSVVGFSVMFEEQLYFALLMARRIKELDGNVNIVFGGNFLTSNEMKDLVRTEPVDFVICNEGEKAALDLLNALNGHKEIDEVPNLVHMTNGKINANNQFMIKNLDELSIPDFSDFDLESYFVPEIVTPILSSRGCYWRRCSFCTHHKSYFNTYRVASVKRVVDELEHHFKSNGIRFFSFVDEMIHPTLFRKIGEEIIKRKLNIYYYALAKPTAHFTMDTLEVMFRSGCRYIIWGVESGCQRVLDLIDKGTNVNDISNVLHNSALAGIRNHVFIFFGFPSETKEEVEKTVNFLYENRECIHHIHRGIFSLRKGSPIFKDPKKFGVETIYDDIKKPNYTSNFRYSVPEGICSAEAKALFEFYSVNFFGSFDSISKCFGHARDHALLFYSRYDQPSMGIEKRSIPEPSELNLQRFGEKPSGY